MTLNEYFKDDIVGAKQEMAEYLGITPTWLSMLMREDPKRQRRASPFLAKKIEHATQGLVTAKELRPDIFD